MKLTNDQRQQALYYYNLGYSTGYIAKHYGVSGETIRQHIRKSGIPRHLTKKEILEMFSKYK